MIQPIRRIGREAWRLRSRSRLLNFPIPWKLRHGPYALLYGDDFGVIAVGLFFHWNVMEERLLEFLTRYLKPGMVVIDVGANQGLYTLVAASRVGAEGRVIAFEPTPYEFRRLRRNVALNRYCQVVLENQAVGETIGNTEYYICLRHGGLSSRRQSRAEDAAGPTRCITVPLVSLDAYLQSSDVGSVDFLKIDTEGGERDVLRGASMLLSKGPRPVILCEVEDRRTQSWGYKAADIMALLEGYGFDLYFVASRGSLRRAVSSQPLQGNNVIAVPQERASSIEFLKEPR